ncbi:MAG TPA: aminotransferase class I/II-fold pyridoxal phosphate-dependent enzyme [Gemmatimonadaceae bacterium]|nr:aminotransferase class I/II-fold pyridoxal phosphate-dependent enzyme [Gemmatimonadaceae bacterium]
MPKYANRLLTLPEYPLGKLPEKKRQLIARGMDVIDLGAGDADLAPPGVAVDRLAAAAHIPTMSRYGFGLGLMEYREAICRWMDNRFGLSFDPITEIVPLIGSKEGISHVALAYAEDGDVTIIPEPGYLAYVGGTQLAQGEPYRYALRPEKDFLVDLGDVPRDVLKRTKILYLNYPNNPTAAIAPREYLASVIARCRELDILLVYDNAYSEMAFDGYKPPSIFEIDGARDVAIEFHSMSKTFNMTGWRCGWAVGSRELVGPLAKVKLFVDTGAFMAVQAASAAALDHASDFVPGNIEVFKQRRDAAVSAFNENGFACVAPKATMYLWIPLPEHITSAEFAEYLMEEEGVIVLPGSSFGAGGEGFFRVSFVTSPERIREAAVRAGRVLSRLSVGA